MTYAVDTFSTNRTSMSGALAALETELESRSSAKTIRYIDVRPTGEKYRGVLIIDA